MLGLSLWRAARHPGREGRVSEERRIFKRAAVRDPQGQTWLIVVEDRLDPTKAKLARDAAERYGRYAMTIYAPNGRSVAVLQDANTIQTDNELNRFRREIAAGRWGADLLAATS
jgi:hypothetical protein